MQISESLFKWYERIIIVSISISHKVWLLPAVTEETAAEACRNGIRYAVVLDEALKGTVHQTACRGDCHRQGSNRSRVADDTFVEDGD